MELKKISSALISVYYKDGLLPLLEALKSQGVVMYSTGGTASFIRDHGFEVKLVEDLTGMPSILGGRVKTLHPKVFGGILARRELTEDLEEIAAYGIPEIDMVVVDLYPFNETLSNTDDESEIIEKIDIGGVSLIRAAAKNFRNTAIIARKSEYGRVAAWLNDQNGTLNAKQRKELAAIAFGVTQYYDNSIYAWFQGSRPLRYGENPHQSARFEGNLSALFEQLNGKELSYNNLLDADAAVRLVKDLPSHQSVFAIIKHNNACGLAIRENLSQAYQDALAGDPVSAFGGILACNQSIDEATARLMNELFFEICIAPEYSPEALELLQSKKNRMLLKWNMNQPLATQIVRTTLNGILHQDADQYVVQEKDWEVVTHRKPTTGEIQDMLFANVVVKHTKSNAIVLFKNGQLLASGTGQTSRVDALKQAIQKAKAFGFELKGAVMSSDAFFPFPDCVEIADEEGITAVIQPGGSKNDALSVDYCNAHEMAMVITGIRHFKH